MKHKNIGLVAVGLLFGSLTISCSSKETTTTSTEPVAQPKIEASTAPEPAPVVAKKEKRKASLGASSSGYSK